MTKYSTDSGDSNSKKDDPDKPSKKITVSISDWLKEALEQIVQQSDATAREAIRYPLEYAVVEWNRTFERQNDEFNIPGHHVWEPNFRCIHCLSSNKFLFRELNTEDDDSRILCLNCEKKMSEEEVTRLSRAAKIQEKDAYTLGKEGVKIQNEYEGEFRTPMRFECPKCKERDLILPDPNKIEVFICPRCGKKGKVLDQVKGPRPKGFKKYPPDKYHTEPSHESIGRGISRGEYDHLEKAYKDGYKE